MSEQHRAIEDWSTIWRYWRAAAWYYLTAEPWRTSARHRLDPARVAPSIPAEQ